MTFNINYFMMTSPAIISNDELREPQLLAYLDTYRHFMEQKSTRDAVVILPTGAGKTGVMALVPYGVCTGRVLIVTPQLVIKDHVVESLDPSEPENFWLKRKVFPSFHHLPYVTEYDKDTHFEELEQSNIVILNIHKLSAVSRNSLLKKVNDDFFDMIIIDEAHHSPAETWQNALNYFSRAKVVKVTGTPFRTDRKQIEGRIITNYRLGRAMALKIVKSLENFKLIPDKLYLTIDNKLDKKYIVEEIRAQGIKDEDYISRSVALSSECNEQIVEQSIICLKEKRLGTDVPHKIIAVACSIDHAESIQNIYLSKGLKAVVVHSDLHKEIRKKLLQDVENHRCDVVIHVAMLGEGYDHPYLSIAAIFRPFRSLAPYSQFIGRILRVIPSEETKKPSDNIGVIVAHRDLDLQRLWEEYRKEARLSEVILQVEKQEKQEKKLEKDLKKGYDKDIAGVEIDGDLSIQTEYYDISDLVKEHEEFEKDLSNKVQLFKSALPNATDEDLKKFILSQDQNQISNPLLKNPKKYRQIIRTSFHNKIHEDIPAHFITEFEVEKENRDFAKAFPARYSWITDIKANDNAAIISIYFNAKMKEKFGDRDDWKIVDYAKAEEYLEQLVEHVFEMIQSSLMKG